MDDFLNNIDVATDGTNGIVDRRPYVIDPSNPLNPKKVIVPINPAKHSDAPIDKATAIQLLKDGGFDVGALLKKQQDEAEAAEKLKTEEFKKEQAEHAKFESEMATEGKKISAEIDENQRLADMGSGDLEKYLNLTKLTQPPQHEAVYKAQNFKTFAILSLIFGALVSRGTGNMAVGVKAMAAGLQGFVNGDRQKYEDGYQEWKDNTDIAVKDNQTRIQAYKDTLANRNLNLDQRLQLLSILAAHGDPYTHSLVKGGDLDKLNAHVNSLSKAMDNYIKKYEQADNALKPVKVEPDVQKATNAILYGDPSIPQPDSSDTSKTPWWYMLSAREASLAQFLKNQDATMTPYQAALSAHQYALKHGWIKKDASGAITVDEGSTSQPDTGK